MCDSILKLAFPPGKSEREISREIWGFEFSRFPGNLCRNPGNFFFHFKGFNGTDIYHSDVKMRACTVEKTFFYSLKIFLQHFQKFFRPNA